MTCLLDLSVTDSSWLAFPCLSFPAFLLLGLAWLGLARLDLSGFIDNGCTIFYAVLRGRTILVFYFGVPG